MARIRTGRELLASSALAALLAAAVLTGAVLAGSALLAMATPHSKASLPAAILTSGSNFGLSGTISNLAPGVPASLLMTADNPFTVPITVTGITVSVTAVPAACAVSYFTINGQAFTGSPPATTIAGLSQPVPAGGTASFPVGILLARTAPNACQDVTLPFSYSGTAVPSSRHPHEPPGGIGGSPVTVVSSRPDPSLAGQRVTFTAELRTDWWQGSSPAGGVTFYLCLAPATLPAGSASGLCQRPAALGRPVPVSGTGRASLTTAVLRPGRHPIFAIFTPAGQAGSPSYSDTVNQVVEVPRPCVTGPGHRHRHGPCPATVAS